MSDVKLKTEEKLAHLISSGASLVNTVKDKNTPIILIKLQ